MDLKIDVTTRVVKICQNLFVEFNPILNIGVALDEDTQQTGLLGVQNTAQTSVGELSVAHKRQPLNFHNTALSNLKYHIDPVVRPPNNARLNGGGDAALIESFTDSPARAAYRTAGNAKKTLMAGFTTVRNLGDGSGATLALRDAVAAGELPGPRIIDAGRSISTTSGHMDATLSVAEDLHGSIGQENLCDGVESCRQAVRKQIRRGVDVIKIATTGGVNSRIGSGLGRQIFDDEVKALVDTAHLYGKKVAVHAHSDDGINAALAVGADSIEHGTMLTDETIKLFKAAGAYYVPTLSTVNGYIERLAANPNAYPPDVLAKVKWRIGVTGKSLAKAYPAGVKIAFGTDAGVSKHGKNADEFELMVKYGMPASAAIQAATMNAATLLGVDKQVGSLEPGKAADLIAVAGDPIVDITTLKSVRFVMKDGRVFKAE